MFNEKYFCHSILFTKLTNYCFYPQPLHLRGKFFIYLEMTKLLLNGSNSVNYTVHGQDLVLNFEFPEARFVSIYYNEIPVTDKFKNRPFWIWNRRSWYKNSGEFKAHVNVYHPFVRITLWSKWFMPKRVMIPLKVNHVKLQASLPRWQLTLPKQVLTATQRVNNFHATLSIPKFKILNTKLQLHTQPISIKSE